MVFLREENNEVIIEDDQRHMVAKFREKGSFGALLGIKFPATANNAKNSPSPSMSNYSQDQYGNSEEEIESYFHQLLLSISDEEGSEIETDPLQNSEAEKEIQENMVTSQSDYCCECIVTRSLVLFRLVRKLMIVACEKELVFLFFLFF